MSGTGRVMPADPDGEETRESLEYVAENYDGAVGAAAEMLLHSPEDSNE